MTWLEHHSQSERYAADAEIACHQHETERSQELYTKAAEAEKQALFSLDTSKGRTYGISAVSLVSLYFKAARLDEAETIETVTAAIRAQRSSLHAELESGSRTEQIRGVLRALHLDRDWIEISVGSESINIGQVSDAVEVGCVQKVGGRPSDQRGQRILEVASNPAVAAALADGHVQVAGGTAWLWAREEFSDAVDVLFIDEAGQMSLANVLAVAPAAANIVLLGDPQQLEQPSRGSHPEGAEVSALEHLLDGAHTVADDRGLFLGETWRLHPAICSFTSELFYDSRLRSRPDLSVQAIVGDTPFAGAGLWFCPVHHHGNQNSSSEEVDRVASVFDALISRGVTWTDRAGCDTPLSDRDILIVAPYNAHVSAIAARLPSAARVGTVDRFQGQEAPVVIYSLATSSPEEAPRGMEFLYSLNRLN